MYVFQNWTHLSRQNNNLEELVIQRFLNPDSISNTSNVALSKLLKRLML